MREHLLGYLLGALEPTEHEMVEARIERDPALRHDLERLRSKVAPLAADNQDHEPPVGLAARTCNFVAARATCKASPATVGGLTPGSSWRLQDLLVAGGICIAASLLVFPAISHSQFNARLMACQNNLREVGVALGHYSEVHRGYFPLVPQQGRLAVAGICLTAVAAADHAIEQRPQILSLAGGYAIGRRRADRRRLRKRAKAHGEQYANGDDQLRILAHHRLHRVSRPSHKAAADQSARR